MVLSSGAKPFLKWAGGKGQLLAQLEQYLPTELSSGAITRYVEPFIGGGAMSFHLGQKFTLEELFISDVNEELILTYRVVSNAVEELVERLSEIEHAYFILGADEQKHFFYEVRNELNAMRKGFNFTELGPHSISRAAQIIFLNRTCFNGLFRVNSKGAFNVPFGKYKNPRICDANNLRAASNLLRNATLECCDFAASGKNIDSATFVYLDPPYRPLTQTSSFTSYSKGAFDDLEQKRLAAFCREIDALGGKFLLSNSDPANNDVHDTFFEELYLGFRIERVAASRMINSKGNGRGTITELVITNY